MSINTVVEAIISGDYDDDLNRIATAIHDRRDIVSRMKTSTISVGDKVKFNDRISPKYLIGNVVTVKKVNKKTVVCDFDVDAEFGRFSGAKNVRVPTSTIDVV